MKKSKIDIEVTLDENKNPVDIQWQAESKDGQTTHVSKAMLLSFFDAQSKETFKIDLWTSDLQIAEMDRLMFNTLKALTETYYTATKNESLSNQMRSFVHHFGLETKIILPED